MSDPRVLGERYELAELIGHGGMADVYRGRDERLGRTVAVKVLRADLARDPSFERRFEREAQASAGMQHANVVAVFDTGVDREDDQPVPYIVMEFVDGSTLKELLSTGRRLLPQRALEITSGVLAALEYSHQRGVIHRDIKPANVMLTRNGEVKVMDFGIARAIDDAQATMTQASTVMGTAQYLSPEQGRGETADGRSDIYGAGCLLYELLTGRPPFRGDTTESVIYQHVRENPVPPSQVDPEVPSGVDAIVLKAMSKNPDNRYATAADMRADILRAIEGQPVRATPLLDETAVIAPTTAIPMTTDLDDTSTSNKRKGYIALAVAVIAALLIGGFFLLKPLFANTATVRVPDLVGLDETAAQASLEREGLILGRVTEQASTATIGRVIEQVPLKGVEAEEGSAVDIVVSSGPAKTVVPQLVGLTTDGARQALERASLELGERTERASDRPAGEVLESDPTEGTSVEAGTRVKIVVSSGRIEVPDVVGKTESEARQILVEAGFEVQVARTQTTVSEVVGRVVEQSPQEGTSASAGATVVISVAEAAPTPDPVPTSTATTPATPPATTATTP
jgi:serine/threonine-protein kinase